MAGLKLMVDLRARHGRPAPETSSEADRKEFEAIATALLGHLRSTFHTQLGAAERAELERIEAGQPTEREGWLAGQVQLARRLPDYWQCFERDQAAYAQTQLEAPPPRAGWLGRLLGS